MINKYAIIKKMPDGKYKILSEKGKHLGTYPSFEKAKKRLKQIEMFKHMKNKRKKSESLLSLLLIVKEAKENATYSSVMRKLRQKNPEKVKEFMKAFKICFDSMDKNLSKEEIEKTCLQQALDECKLTNII